VNLKLFHLLQIAFLKPFLVPSVPLYNYIHTEFGLLIVESEITEFCK